MHYGSIQQLNKMDISQYDTKHINLNETINIYLNSFIGIFLLNIIYAALTTKLFSRKIHIWLYTTMTLTDKLPKHFFLQKGFNGGNEEIVDGNIRRILFDIKRIWFCIQK